MAGVTGLEPAASGVTGRRSNQLSYTPISCHREGAPHVRQRLCQVNRPASAARGFSCDLMAVVVGDDGIEPPTLSV
jgi:hypothetical protein